MNSMNNSVDMCKKRADNMATIAILMFYLAPLLSLYIGTFSYNFLLGLFCIFLIFCPVVGVIIVIVGRIRYPDNKALRTVMWAIIITVIVILFLMYFFSQITVKAG